VIGLRRTLVSEDERVTGLIAGLGVVGDFSMPNEGNSIEVQGLKSNHSLSEFSITIDVTSWSEFEWGFHASSGGQDFEVHIARTGGNKCTNVDEIEVGVYYYNGTTSEYQGWQNQSVDVDDDTNFDVDCSDETLTANFSGTTELGYDTIETGSSGNKTRWYYESDINDGSITSRITFDQHPEDDSGGRDGVYNHSDSDEETEEIGFVMAHYFGRLGPNFELTVIDGPGASSGVDEGASEGNLEYDATEAGFITFLHVTENDLDVDLG